MTREFSTDIATADWRQLLWHADDEPEGLKALDLDEEEEAAEPAAPRRRKKKENKGEATEQDLAALDATNWEEVKSEVDALRQRLGAMGAVNLVAIEEYAELKQRYEFLTRSRSCLAAAEPRSSW
jgi:chromosome segregation protein